jgi:hypothetical protein
MVVHVRVIDRGGDKVSIVGDGRCGSGAGGGATCCLRAVGRARRRGRGLADDITRRSGCLFRVALVVGVVSWGPVVAAALGLGMTAIWTYTASVETIDAEAGSFRAPWAMAFTFAP